MEFSICLNTFPISCLVICSSALTGVWKCSIFNTFSENIINIREHVSEAGGHDDTATETHHTGEDLGHLGAALGLLPGDPASSHRHHGNQTYDPGSEAEYQHRHYLGGQQETFHLALALRKRKRFLMKSIRVCYCRTLIELR